MKTIKRESVFCADRVPLYFKNLESDKVYGPIYGGDSIDIEENGMFEFYLISLFFKKKKCINHILLNGDLTITLRTRGNDWEPIVIEIKLIKGETYDNK